MPTTSTSLLEERYGRSRRVSRPVRIALVAVLAAVGTGWVLWAAAHFSYPPVSAQVRAFTVESDHAVTVTLSVARRGSPPVRCDVYAEAADSTVVGERTVEIPAGGDETVTLTRRITTERAAVSARLRGCAVLTTP